MLAKTYKKFRRLSPYIRRELGRLQLLDNEMLTKRFVFIHIPKAAGTSISNALGIKDPGHYLLSDYKKRMGADFDDFFKFAFVRDPWDRVASTYSYASRHAKEYPNSSVSFVTQYNSFEDFVTHWINPVNISKHYFFKPCAEYLCIDKNIGVDFIGRFENIDNDFEVISSKLGLKIKLPHKNANREIDYRALYTDSMTQIVSEAYKDDIYAFNYKF